VRLAMLVWHSVVVQLVVGAVGTLACDLGGCRGAGETEECEREEEVSGQSHFREDAHGVPFRIWVSGPEVRLGSRGGEFGGCGVPETEKAGCEGVGGVLGRRGGGGVGGLSAPRRGWGRVALGLQ
jgi:hypothetical protein